MWTVEDLQELLDSVQSRFTYVPDEERFGEADYWMTISDLDADGKLRGDCDDHALLCRHELRAKYIPNRLLFCQCENGEYHLVCEVDGWILDNRFERVISRDDLQYRWIAISGFEAGEPWHEIVAD